MTSGDQAERLLSEFASTPSAARTASGALLVDEEVEEHDLAVVAAIAAASSVMTRSVQREPLDGEPASDAVADDVGVRLRMPRMTNRGRMPRRASWRIASIAQSQRLSTSNRATFTKVGRSPNALRSASTSLEVVA